jgi:hypothetical protein
MKWWVPEVQDKGWLPNAGEACILRVLWKFVIPGVKRSDTLTLQDGPIGCPETSVNNPQTTTRNTPEERRPHILSARQSELQSFPCLVFAVHVGCLRKDCLDLPVWQSTRRQDFPLTLLHLANRRAFALIPPDAAVERSYHSGSSMMNPRV